jgi:hypothetical protein
MRGWRLLLCQRAGEQTLCHRESGLLSVVLWSSAGTVVLHPADIGEGLRNRGHIIPRCFTGQGDPGERENASFSTLIINMFFFDQFLLS